MSCTFRISRTRSPSVTTYLPVPRDAPATVSIGYGRRLIQNIGLYMDSRSGMSVRFAGWNTTSISRYATPLPSSRAFAR